MQQERYEEEMQDRVKVNRGSVLELNMKIQQLIKLNKR